MKFCFCLVAVRNLSLCIWFLPIFCNALICSELTIVTVLGDHYWWSWETWMLEIEFRLAACKASALTNLLSLWPHFLTFWFQISWCYLLDLLWLVLFDQCYHITLQFVEILPNYFLSYFFFLPLFSIWNFRSSEVVPLMLVNNSPSIIFVFFILFYISFLMDLFNVSMNVKVSSSNFILILSLAIQHSLFLLFPFGWFLFYSSNFLHVIDTFFAQMSFIELEH